MSVKEKFILEMIEEEEQEDIENDIEKNEFEGYITITGLPSGGVPT